MNNTKEVQAMQLPIQKLRPFENHPFQVKDDDEMNQLVWSVLTQGVLTPLVVRPLENDEYEVISGHRRLHACQRGCLKMICENHEGRPSFLHEAVEKLLKKYKKTAH